MKIYVYMKDPDTLHDCIREAAEKEVEALGLPYDEADAVIERRMAKASEVCERWFKYGEYVGIDVDTEAGTATVREQK